MTNPPVLADLGLWLVSSHGHSPADKSDILIMEVNNAFRKQINTGLSLGGEGRELLALATVALLSAALSGLGMVRLLPERPAVAA
ncbi:MAG: hypothetical protein L0332_24550 [Chloroflexi bacterium]|nr:hypothetical protein [Chloroflexota bacterium]MCI0579876.1 hypothetical protein [Chloroflexota bacterium]MCI0646157.1 hypothetical protein [Chloroflexota bacterium]MCI0729867.1 hypothetical protein [Chloroflexota bacterium]